MTGYEKGCSSELRRVREIRRKLDYFKRCESCFDALGIVGIISCVFSYSMYSDTLAGIQNFPMILTLVVLVIGGFLGLLGFLLGSRYSRLADECSRRIRNF